MKQYYIYLEESWYTWKGTPIKDVQHQLINNVRIIKDEFDKEIYEFKDSKGDIYFSNKTKCIMEYTPENIHLLNSITYYQHQIDVLNNQIKDKSI